MRGLIRGRKDAPGPVQAIPSRGELAGFTLIEIVLAMGVLVIVIGATAQVLINFAAAMHLTAQRNDAIQNCASVLNEMRLERTIKPANFPAALLARFPHRAQVRDAQGNPLYTTLPGEVLTVVYTNSEGVPLPNDPGPLNNPLHVAVSSQWTTLRGRTVTVSLSAILTSQ